MIQGNPSQSLVCAQLTPTGISPAALALMNMRGANGNSASLGVI